MADWWWTFVEAVQQFQLLRPWWLLLLPVAMLLPIILAYLQRHSEWEGFIEPALLKPILQPQKQQGVITPTRLASLLLILWLLALAGPSWREKPSPFTDDKAPLVIALALTESMLADDLLPSRLARAKIKVAQLLDARRGSPTALIAYSGSAHVVLPLTEDVDILKLYLDGLAPDVMPEPGLNIQAALQAAGDLLNRDGKRGSIVLVGDQLDSTSVNPLDEQQSISLLLVGPSAATAEEALQSRSASHVDVAEVKDFAERENIHWVAMTADESDVSQLQRRIIRQFESQQRDDEKAQREDAGYYLLFPLTLIMLLWFRRGMVLQWQ
ncbi:hypothetical protein R50073_02080 [Maricurvus nonylphenolicus]|uniref:vWA domain-containing protein n=1 Tax=Maricurvus nonylphenolicus TaxID=1008307 RepID=UPI0036F3FF43